MHLEHFYDLGILFPINPIQPILWTDVMTGVGGGESWPPLFFQLWGYQKPKSEPLHFFCTKIKQFLLHMIVCLQRKYVFQSIIQYCIFFHLLKLSP